MRPETGRGGDINAFCALVNAPSALSLCAIALYELVIGAGYDFPASTRLLTDREYFTARSDGSGEVSMKDKRRAPRRPMRCTAWIALAPGKLYGCVVADISDTGGRLDVEDAEAVPDTFMLWLASNAYGRIAAAARHQIQQLSLQTHAC